MTSVRERHSSLYLWFIILRDPKYLVIFFLVNYSRAFREKESFGLLLYCVSSLMLSTDHQSSITHIILQSPTCSAE